MRSLLKCSQCGAMLPPGTTACPRDGARPVQDNPFTDESTVRRDPDSSPGNARATAPEQSVLSDEELEEDVRQSSWEATVSRDVLVGKQLGDFIVKRRIGAGGMGIVYEGEHPIIGRKVAIKILRPEFSDGGGARDLVAEARAASAIRHRGIIDVFGFGTIPHVGQYLVMEYLEGAPLDEVIAQRAPMQEAEVIALLDELLAALGAAHAMGVIHRDLKPGNIFVVRDSGGGEAVKVLDFGLAKRSEAPHGTSPQTRASMIVGTPEYMAPEQASGHAVGPHTDLYSVGVIAFEMLTRRLPFEGPSAMAIAIQHVQAKPPPPSNYVDLHPDLDDLVLRLLAKTAAQRPPSAEAVRRELKAISRQMADDATRLEPAPRGEAPRAQLPSVRNERTPAHGRPAPRNSRPEVDSVTITRTANSNPEENGSRARLAPMPPRDMANPEPRHAPATERVSSVRPSRVPQIVVGALLALALVGGGLWALLRGDSTEVQPPIVVGTTPDPGPPQPVTPKEPPVDVKPPPDGTASAPTAQQGNGTNPNTTANAPEEPGTLHLIITGWANVYVDGRPRGRVPPKNYLELPPGQYKVELKNPKAKPYVVNITIKPGETTKHVVKFEPKASSPTEAP